MNINDAMSCYPTSELHCEATPCSPLLWKSSTSCHVFALFYPAPSNLLPLLFSLPLSCLPTPICSTVSLNIVQRLSVILSSVCWCSCSCFSTTESASNLVLPVSAPKYVLFSGNNGNEPRVASFWDIYIWRFCVHNPIICYSHQSPTVEGCFNIKHICCFCAWCIKYENILTLQLLSWVAVWHLQKNNTIKWNSDIWAFKHSWKFTGKQLNDKRVFTQF